MFGQGLITGLGVTIKKFFGKKITQQYPEEMPNLPPRSHGFFTFHKDKCTACTLCANACPNRVIRISTERDENKKKYLTEYTMDLCYCLFCGLCVETCPTQALTWNQNFELAQFHRKDTSYTLYDRSQDPQPHQDAENNGMKG
ncbi:NuoI/complex I 23 kDa subunit family protein [Candidatus Formimonas warabiya]|uniref:NADH-quinone oxidoreductase subunit I n=1 Tax=Formimonas warabiya TaxID=1761012 RepID=A0A3G1L067_FORW1|nr:NADH-quinone oxidoreductase subunit I [Candidatus Formimonas warabiya]ATW28034.1 NADH-quinone oxidoreductase subunit I [Candidatus Formimonas warabiya]